MPFFLKKVGGALIRVGALNRDYTVTYIDRKTNRRTYPVIEMRKGKLISNEFRNIFCAVNVSFLHFLLKALRMDGGTDRRTYPLIEMRGRIQKGKNQKRSKGKKEEKKEKKVERKKKSKTENE